MKRINVRLTELWFWNYQTKRNEFVNVSGEKEDEEHFLTHCAAYNNEQLIYYMHAAQKL